jgi:fructoselysine 3-epimerase
LTIRLSCCTLGYNRTTSLEESIRRIARLGYKGVDLYTGAPHLWPEDYPHDERMRVKKLIAELNLQLTGFAVAGGGLALQLNFSSHRESLRKATLQYYVDNVELANEMGAPLINVLTGHVLYGTNRRQAMKWTMDALQELTEVAEKNKVILGLHPQYIAESPLMLNVDDALEMIEDLKSSYVKVIYDTAQQNISNRNFEDDIRKCGKNLCYVHAADNDGVTWTHEACGKGNVDWPGLVAALKEISFDGFICVQAWSPLTYDADTVMRESKAYLETLLGKGAA